jgi:hypothetical protein
MPGADEQEFEVGGGEAELGAAGLAGVDEDPNNSRAGSDFRHDNRRGRRKRQSGGEGGVVVVPDVSRPVVGGVVQEEIAQRGRIGELRFAEHAEAAGQREREVIEREGELLSGDCRPEVRERSKQVDQAVDSGNGGKNYAASAETPHRRIVNACPRSRRWRFHDNLGGNESNRRRRKLVLDEAGHGRPNRSEQDGQRREMKGQAIDAHI